MEFRLVRKKDVSFYYVKLNNQGGRCPYCGNYVNKVKENRKKKIALTNGYFIFERIRKKITYCENYYEIYSKEPLKNTVRRTFPQEEKKDT